MIYIVVEHLEGLTINLLKFFETTYPKFNLTWRKFS